MKNFEKWWEDFNRTPLPADEYDFSRMAWKAALEWALAEQESDSWGVIYVPCEAIKEELNE